MTDSPTNPESETARGVEKRSTGDPSAVSPLQTEFEFTLPHGYVDDEGTLHRDGTMRLATAADEIKPLKDPRVQSNESYLTVILLSRVVTSLGTLPDVTPHVIENLFVSDLSHLQELYERINTRNANAVDAACPDCGETFEVPVGPEATTPVSTGDTEVGAGNPED